jgi:hypothetical protein
LIFIYSQIAPFVDTGVLKQLRGEKENKIKEVESKMSPFFRHSRC